MSVDLERAAERATWRGIELPARYREIAAEYESARTAAVVFSRRDRGIVRLTGRDRKPWLHNLVTNDVNKLADSEGCYAFAIDLRGRVQFDLNILSLADAILLDLDRSTIPAAIPHLKRYCLVEDVRLADESAAWGRIAVSGPGSMAIAGRLGVTGLEAAGSLVSKPLGSGWVFRHDIVGMSAFEWILPVGEFAAGWQRLVDEMDLLPAGQQVLNAMRIEAGIPWLGNDIDDKTLPPETGQVERGISYHKGCYLGQEVIERMRSHNVLAKRLVRLAMDDGEGVELPTPLRKGDAEVGRVTSLVQHPLSARWIGLGYLRTSVKEASGISTGAPPRDVEILL